MSSSLSLTGWFEYTQATAISSTILGVDEEVYPPPMTATIFTKPVLELESSCTANDKDKDKKRKTDQMAVIVNGWLTYPNPVSSCYTGTWYYMFLDFPKSILLVEQQQVYMGDLKHLIINKYSISWCVSCDNVHCVGKLDHICW